MSRFISNGLEYSFSNDGDQINVFNVNGDLIAIANNDTEYFNVSYYDEHGEIMDIFNTTIHENHFNDAYQVAVWLAATHPEIN